MNTLMKFASLSIVVGSISACGGGSSVQEVQDMVDQQPTIEIDVTDYDTNGDGWLSARELATAWQTLSTAQKTAVATALGQSVSDLDQYAAAAGSSYLADYNFAQGEADTRTVAELRTNLANTLVAPAATALLNSAQTSLTNLQSIQSTLQTGQVVGISWEDLRTNPAVLAVGGLPEEFDGMTGLIDPQTLAGLMLTVQGLISEANTAIDDYSNFDANAVIAQWYSSPALSINGLEQAHIDGWTGVGVSIGIYDGGSHGFDVTNSAAAVAPGATVNYNNTEDHDTPFVHDNFITNHSYGTAIQDFDADGNLLQSGISRTIGDLNGVYANNPDSLQVVAGPNVGDCPEGQTADICDGASVAFLNGDLDGEILFVGSYGASYTSTAVGTNTVLQNNWIVTEGSAVSSTAVGSSFAAPKVAGAAALVKHKFTNLNAGQVKNILLETADDDFTGYAATQHGQGLLDIGAALSPVGSLR